MRRALESALANLAAEAVEGSVELSDSRFGGASWRASDARVWLPQPPLLPGEAPTAARIQHPVAIWAAALSPDERFLALGGGSTLMRGGPERIAEVTLWDDSRGEIVSRLQGLTECLALVFSRDGSRLASRTSLRMGEP
ncbi:MAG: hypothetical protein HYY06_31755 [Deltaproteobacteria bacterium]|nr:hypothetical protein [Deltaproteobacteria bacterium]